MNSEAEKPRKNLYLKVFLFFFLMLVATFFLMGALVGGILGPIMTGDVTLIVGGIIFFGCFIILMLAAKKFEPAWKEYEALKGIKRKTTRESIKDNIPFFALMLSSLILAFIFEEYFLNFPETITSTLGKEILNSILTVDGIIIGLCGVVLAQFLWALHSKGNILFEQMIVNYKDSNVTEWLNNELDNLNRIRAGTVVAISFSVVPPLASLLICLSKLPMTDGVAVVPSRTLLFDPISVMVVGVVGLIWITSQVNLLPKKPPIIKASS